MMGGKYWNHHTVHCALSQFFRINFVKVSNGFIKEITEPLNWRNFFSVVTDNLSHLSFFHTHTLCCYTVWKFANFPPTIFCKISVKWTFSLKSYTVNQFDEKIFQWGKISEISTLCVMKNENFCENFVNFTKFSSYSI